MFWKQSLSICPSLLFPFNSKAYAFHTKHIGFECAQAGADDKKISTKELSSRVATEKIH